METRRMRVASRKKQKPEVGMELTMTISMKQNSTIGESADAILEFFKAATALSEQTQATWVKVRCAGIPEAFEHLMAAAMEQAQAELDAKEAPRLALVVDNTKEKAS